MELGGLLFSPLPHRLQPISGRCRTAPVQWETRWVTAGSKHADRLAPPRKFESRYSPV